MRKFAETCRLRLIFTGLSSSSSSTYLTISAMTPCIVVSARDAKLYSDCRIAFYKFSCTSESVKNESVGDSFLLRLVPGFLFFVNESTYVCRAPTTRIGAHVHTLSFAAVKSIGSFYSRISQILSMFLESYSSLKILRITSGSSFFLISETSLKNDSISDLIWLLTGV